MKRLGMTVAALAFGGVLWALEGGVDQWVKDLGDENPGVREKAVESLAEMGEGAREALEKATGSEDPERAYQAKRLLKRLERSKAPVEEPEVAPDAPRPPRPGRRMRGGSMRVIIGKEGQTTIQEDADGRLVVTEKVDGETKTYEGDSREDFAEKHPEVAKKYGLDGQGRGGFSFGPPDREDDLFGPEMRERLRKMQEEMLKQHEELMKRLEGMEGLEDFEQELEKLLQGGGGLMDPAIPPPAQKPILGISVAPVSEALRYQLDLPEGGILVTEVGAGTRAGKLGLEKHDILVSVNGRNVASAADIRAAVTGDDPISAEVIRGGERIALKE